jgi:hypothetical protein
MYSKETGAQFGKHLASTHFVEVFQKMWKTHLGLELFENDTMNENLLYSMMISIQVGLCHISPKVSIGTTRMLTTLKASLYRDYR